MKFTKRDDILLAWENNGIIEQYIPLVQSAGISLSTNVASITQSSTYEKRKEIFTAPTVEISMEILGKDKIFNEELHFIKSPTETEQGIIDSINSPINLLILLNDTNEYDDLIDYVEKSTTEKDLYRLKIYNCYLNSYSISIEAGGLITHSLGLSGNNIDGDRTTIGADNYLTNLRPKNIGLASKINLYSSNGLFSQPVSSLTMSFNVDRKTKYVFTNKSDIGDRRNNHLAPKINDAESSVVCTLTIETINDLKSTDFTTEYIRETSSLFKDFKIVFDEPSSSNAPIRTSINFYDTTLNNVEVEENIDGLMNVSYSFDVIVPTGAVSSSNKGVTTRKRLEKYVPAKNRNDMLSIDSNYRTDLRNGVWDWDLDNLEDGRNLFNFQDYPGQDLLTEFNTRCCPKLKNAERMFVLCKKHIFNCLVPNLENGNWMFANRGAGTEYGLIGEFNQKLPKAKILSSMFSGCENLESVHIEAPEVTDVNSIVLECKNLKKIYLDIPKARNINYAFDSTLSCESYEFPSGFPEALNAYSLFNNAAIKEVPWKFPKAKDCGYMFNETTNLEELNLTLPECTSIFRFASYSKALKKVILDIPKCTRLNDAFRDILTLKELTIKRHNSTSASTVCYRNSQLDKIDMDFSNINQMSYFAEGSGLLDFKHNLSKITNGNNAFMSSLRMHEFNSALPSLETGNNMFRWSQLLETFRYPVDEDGNSIYESGKPQAVNSDGSGLFAYLTLPKAYHLTECFSYIRADLPSALSVLKSLRQKVDIQNPIINPPSWTITLSMENTYQNNVELANAIEQAKTKGWTVLMQWQTPRPRNFRSSRKNTLPFLNQENLFLLKKIEDENGIFEDEFGKRFEIIGGNEIYSEEGQFGYERFSSYEEAIDKWRLVYKGSMLSEIDEYQEPPSQFLF